MIIFKYFTLRKIVDVLITIQVALNLFSHHILLDS